MRSQRGFTLIELVMTIVLVGILAVFAIPRFMDKTFQERGFRDASKALLQHARHLAVASRRYTCVSVAAGSGSAASLTLTIDATFTETPGATSVNCSTTVPLPSPTGGCNTNQACAPSGVSIAGGSASTVIFDPLGRSVTSAKVVSGDLSISISNQTAITIYGETGYIE